MFRSTLSPRTWRYLTALTLVLSGCQRAPPSGTVTVTGAIAGTVTEGWPGQAASLRLEAVTLASAKVLAEAPIAADGRFALTLPARAILADAPTPAETLSRGHTRSPRRALRGGQGLRLGSP